MKQYLNMRVSGVVMDPRSNLPVVILKDENSTYLMPIWIGVMEASAIAATKIKAYFIRSLSVEL